MEVPTKKINKNKNGEHVPHLGTTELLLVNCSIVNSDYQHDLRVLYTFLTNKSIGQLLGISAKNFKFLKTFNSEFYYIEVWFTEQNSKLLEIKDKINIILVIN